jgi:high-affinity nickel-transport protein
MMRSGLARLFGPLIAANVFVWAAAIALFGGHAVLMGAALLAYTLGLRHAVDADHVAAIDNVTRKLMAARRDPARTGLYFSLGHSTVVWLAALGIAFAATAAGPKMESLRAAGGVFGTSISVLFLFAIALANLVVLKDLIGAVRRQRRGGTVAVQELDTLLAPRGLYTRLLRPVFRMVTKSRHMFAVGFLFGLGFDTATEIGVLGISAAAAGHGMPVWAILIFPALFTAGMSLVDTLDSVLMTGAYGWAFTQPARKLYYNLTVTFFSVVVAVVVGGIEALTLVRDRLVGPAQALVARLGDSMDGAGYTIVAAFLGLWLVSLLVWRLTSARPVRVASNRAHP